MIQINIQSPFLDPKDFNHPTILNSHSLKLNCQKLVYIIYKYVCMYRQHMQKLEIARCPNFQSWPYFLQKFPQNGFWKFIKSTEFLAFLNKHLLYHVIFIRKNPTHLFLIEIIYCKVFPSVLFYWWTRVPGFGFFDVGWAQVKQRFPFFSLRYALLPKIINYVKNL